MPVKDLHVSSIVPQRFEYAPSPDFEAYEAGVLPFTFWAAGLASSDERSSIRSITPESSIGQLSSLLLSLLSISPESDFNSFTLSQQPEHDPIAIF